MAEEKEVKEWTLMFYFAGDNALAPVIVSQLKAIKDAGFQEDIDVLIHFDPNEFGVPTRIYDVNRKRKRDPDLPNSMIGDGKDPFVRNLVEDDIKPEEIGDAIPSNALRREMEKPDSSNAEKSLTHFLNFCREKHQAKRYMLFLVGHGMVVGNDAFLPDDNPVSSITLKKLGEILEVFRKDPADDVESSDLELLALHSCSMGSIEVAYELKGKANYMMASEGPSFVGSWPYRQLLKKIFNNMEKAKKRARKRAKKEGTDQNEAANNPRIDVRKLVEDLYFLTLSSATDFMYAGYSHDLALCSLNPQKFSGVTEAIQNLVVLLKGGLDASSGQSDPAAAERGKRIKELILLAHWEAQSYWVESYTDLFDFCRCLKENCSPKDGLEDLRAVCQKVMEKLDTVDSKDRSERFQSLVIRSNNFGSQFQYSHGLSIYFPWSRPIETMPKRRNEEARGEGKSGDGEADVLARYREYAFTTELVKNAWLDFLESYFKETQRRPRTEEDKKDGKDVESNPKIVARAAGIFNPSAPLSRLSDDPIKPNPRVGADCTCTSIKNYPQIPKEETGEHQGKTARNALAFSITQGALKPFE